MGSNHFLDDTEGETMHKFAARSGDLQLGLVLLHLLSDAAASVYRITCALNQALISLTEECRLSPSSFTCLCYVAWKRGDFLSNTQQLRKYYLSSKPFRQSDITTFLVNGFVVLFTLAMTARPRQRGRGVRYTICVKSLMN
jgi:hypothetical protein